MEHPDPKTFIDRWKNSGAAERANYQLFLSELCDVLGVPRPEGRPPLLIVVDVGHSIELYSEFTCTGGTYVPFPDPRSHRLSIVSTTLASKTRTMLG